METIINFFGTLHPVTGALLGTLFTWGSTGLGAGFVVFTKDVNQKLLDMMLGFTGGVMIAASFWSLLSPAIEMAVESGGVPGWFPAAVGFLIGVLFLYGIDKLLPHLHIGLPRKDAEGLDTQWRRSILLMLAITLHNIPEGLAVGVAFGAVGTGLPSANLGAAVALALGIGIQNFPEGMAISVPLRREGVSRFQSFNMGQLSAIVEPIAAIIGAAAVLYIRPILPYALAFAAGAMIFVVVEEVIPESQHSGNTDLSTLGLTGGFIIMMILDVAFG